VGGLKAGAAAVDITPPLGIRMAGYFEERVARDVHDPLFAKALALDDGETTLVIVVCDLLGVKRERLDEAKRLIRERTGIPPSNVLICCTHTHTGPDVDDLGYPPSREGGAGDFGYGELLARKIADAAQLAVERLEWAEVGVEREEEPKPLGNRRFYMRDGTVWTNPGLRNPDIVGPAGPVDPELLVLCARSRGGGRTVGLLANYAMHYAGLSPTGKGEDMYTISADYFGLCADIVQRVRGERFVATLANGASGDVVMFDAMKPHKEVNKFMGHAERVAALLAAKTVWAWNQMDFAGDVKLAAAAEEVAIPRRFPTEAEIEFASKLARGEVRAVNMRHLALKHFFHPRLDEFLSAPKYVRTWVQALAIGDQAAVVGLPGELFVELGLRIKRGSPFKYTFVCGLANDYVGYVPTLKAFREEGPLEKSGSYETTIGPNVLVPEAGDVIVETALKLLHKLYDEVSAK
jgi:hypothetical protein